MMSLNLPVSFQVDDKALNQAFNDLLNNVKGSKKALNDLLGGEERIELKIDTKINDKGVGSLTAIEKETLEKAQKLFRN